MEDVKRAIVLNAVLVSGADSLANVNGTVVRIGELVQGYRLVEVHDRSAVFEKNNLRFTLDMPSAQKKDAQPFQPRPIPAAVGSDAK